MDLNSLLIGISSFAGGFGETSVSHEWIVNIIRWIVSFAGDVGLGIILFTLALKLITLPLDILSRASMRKNSLKMEMMKPELEKLQKQYANNQQLYQQKMMALYKKNGYSAFSACLPTIITLVFFFIVLGGFNSYSRYSEKQVFNEMGGAYAAAIEAYEGDVLVKADENQYNIDLNKVLSESEYKDLFDGWSEEVNTDEKIYLLKDPTSLPSEFIGKYSLEKYFSDGGYDYSNSELTEGITGKVWAKLISMLSEETRATLSADGVISGDDKIEDLGKFYAAAPDEVKAYFSLDENGAVSINYGKIINEDADIKSEFDANAKRAVSETAIKNIAGNKKEEIQNVARKAAEKEYENSKAHSAIVPWVKNLWVVDSPFSSAIKDYEGFKKSVGDDNVGTLTENAYAEITYYLESEKQTGFGSGNGLFILVAISILSMLGSTFVSNKTQQAQTQLSTVDGANGTAASTQKMMMWMMPIMFGIFAFIYSAAFSLYMITSTLLSTGSTLAINFFVEKAFNNKIKKEAAEKAEKKKYGKLR